MLPRPPINASYVVPVRTGQLLQSRLVIPFGHALRFATGQTSPRGRRPCGLLTGFGNLPVRDFHPLECWVFPKFIPYIWEWCPFKAHTQSIKRSYRLNGDTPFIPSVGGNYKEKQ